MSARSCQPATFVFLSGTGNSRLVAHWLAEAARAAGIAAEAVPMAASRARAPEAGLLGLVYPTHGFTAPWYVLRYALGLPRGRAAQAVVIATRAGAKVGRVFTPGLEGTAVYLVGLILALKGYRLRAALGVDMPSNWTAVHPGFGPEAAEAITSRARARATSLLERVLAGRTAFRGLLPLLLGLALAPVSLGYLVWGRFLFAKLFFATTRCNACGLCARLCPVGSLRVKGGDSGRPYWGLGCESCMRCMNFCPRRAVEVGYLSAVLLSLATSLPVAAAVASWAGIGGLPPLLARPARFAVEYAWYLSALSAGYAVLWHVLRVRFVNGLFAWATPTRWYRRYRAPGTTAADLEGRQGRTAEG
ncbi:MAG: 4Fe-4S dicluster domain-containing protein [Deltaproteobacteria bacterium]|nr:4Fe-4S dicluster domain-containing protein [Deltaproteobacteria bacterium]